MTNPDTADPREAAVARLSEDLERAMRGGYVAELPTAMIAERLIDSGWTLATEPSAGGDVTCPVCGSRFNPAHFTHYAFPTPSVSDSSAVDAADVGGERQADLDWLMLLIIDRATNEQYHRAKGILTRLGAKHPGATTSESRRDALATTPSVSDRETVQE